MPSVCSASNRLLTASAVTLAFVATFSVAPARCAEKTLYKFQGGSEGYAPWSALLADKVGNLYGTTAGGGGGTGCDNGSEGCGTVFELRSDGNESVLYAFKGGSDGAFPRSGLIVDGAGNLYGTTETGGSDSSGTVFRVEPDGTETVLYTFLGGSDGEIPESTLLMDGSGDLFGTTLYGGSFNGSDCSATGCGTVFELEPDGTKVPFYTFQGGNDGWNPTGTLVADQSGNLYGTTIEGGNGGANCSNGSFGCGTIFKIAPDGTETQLYAVQGGSHDGSEPRGGLVADTAGNFYGTTQSGGPCSLNPNGCGTVFKLAADGKETLLYEFRGGNDGLAPQAQLIMDKKGNLYGTTVYGGGSQCGGIGCGTVFEVTANAHEKVLYAFQSSRGRHPLASLLLGAHGRLYGTTANGGKDNNGVVFQVKTK